MQSMLGRAILKTLCYSDLFDYPLTEEEIRKWLIEYKDAKMQRCKDEIRKINIIKLKNELIFLKGRDHVVDLRKQREKWSNGKLKTAAQISSVLKLIPTIKLVGVTGGLAINNADKDDDIDLFIVTSGGLLWTTRLLVTLLLDLLGKRRRPKDLEVSGKICLNMFVDENHLSVQTNERDLYSAHEVLQMKPIWDRDNTYQKFLSANRWVENYLPNAYRELALAESDKDTSNGGEVATSTPPRWRNQVMKITESLLKRFQLWYMRKRRTTEIIKEGVIRFHPKDARVWVMEKYKERLSKLKLLL